MADLLDDSMISQALTDLDWDRDGNELVKVWKGKDFAAAMRYVNAVAERAEAKGHHPDVYISWNKVTLRQWTHVAGGITQADLDLAEEIDRIALG